MILKTKDFNDVASTILLAVDDVAANLELTTKDNELRLNVTNKAYYVSVKFPIDTDETFHAVVDAKAFLNLISKFTADTFSLQLDGNNVVIKQGKSTYKVQLVYENDKLIELTPIILDNVMVDMPISNEILTSIVNVNSKEILKTKNLDVSELQKLYYVDETGCFTFSTGACLNSFTLDKPVKLLLNDKLVKLFKLFKETVAFSYGVDAIKDGSTQTKVVFQTDKIYLAAILNCDDILLSKIQGPCNATKGFISENYADKVVVNVSELSSAISRLMSFVKDSGNARDNRLICANVKISADELSITDLLDNTEVITTDGSSTIQQDGYEMTINLVDLKLVLDTCKIDHITINCGNHRSVVIVHGNVSNLIPECVRQN